jgi:hypothetical protein
MSRILPYLSATFVENDPTLFRGSPAGKPTSRRIVSVPVISSPLSAPVNEMKYLRTFGGGRLLTLLTARPAASVVTDKLRAPLNVVA